MNISESCYLDIPSPTFNRYLFDFEKNFDYWRAFHWFENNWKICFYIVGVYGLGILAGHLYMKSRPPFQLRVPLFVWNLTLALFSITAATRMFPEIYFSLKELGFFGSMCTSSYAEQRRAIGFWAFMFTIFKVVELGDTAFIVLRKSKLIFLHWYHHISVLVFTWSSSCYPSAMQSHFFIANLLMHSLVYSYYALKVLQVRIPRRVNMVVTSLQLFEMLYGVFVAYSTYTLKARNPECCVFDQAIKLAAGIYFSYFVLFLNFFIKSYISNKGEMFDERGVFKKLT